MSPFPLGILGSARAGTAPDPIGGMAWQWRFESDSITGVPDGAKVATWPDTSGNSRHATQATDANRPTFDADAFGELPGVMFSPLTDQRLVTAAVSALSQPTTIWMVATAEPGTGSSAWINFDGIDASNRHTAWVSGNVATYAYAGSTWYAGDASFLGAAGVFAWRFNGASSAVWRNGTAGTGGDVGTHALTGLTIGNRFVNAESTGRTFGAFLIVNAAQSASDMNTVGDYLATKYGYTWTDI